MKNLFILFALLCACGSYDDDGFELGQDEQAMTIEKVGFGWRSDSTPDQQRQRNCVDNSTTQVCLLPADKDVRYRVVTAGIAADDLTTTNNALTNEGAALNSQTNVWTFAFGSGQGLDLDIAKGTVDNAAGASDIRRYVRLVCNSQSANLTETPSALNGTYARCSKATATVDYDKIHATFGVMGSPFVVDQAVSGAVAQMTGLGLTLATGFVTSTATSGVSKSRSITTTDSCRLNGFNPATPASISTTFNCTP